MSEQSWLPVALSVGALAALGVGGGVFAAWKSLSASPAKPVASARPPSAVSAQLEAHRGSCPEGMVFVPAGTFKMGAPDSEGKDEEHPAHEVKVDAFCIGGTEVTVSAYRTCTEDERNELKCSPPHTFASCNWNNSSRSRHPVNCVDWEQASNYCKWAGGSLPTEAQWEYAARGTDGRKYPWGNQPPEPTLLNACGRECTAGMAGRKALYSKADRFSETAPVGSFPDGASPFGALDMAGNVAEWVADPREPYPGGKPFPKDPGETGPNRTIRGGSYFSGDPGQVTATARQLAFNGSMAAAGFRCVHAP